ncbi:MAG: iron ABC transporter permease, partial [Firmicutes bacterium]|nr:iron ABC transporter permease [Bacillota bacterium]
VDYSFTLENFRYGLEVGSKAIMDTTRLALLAGPITGLFGMIVAFLVVRGRFRGKSALEFSAMLPMAVPGTVIGVAYVLTFNTPPLILTGTAWILLFAFIFRTMPVGIRSGVAALHQIDPAIEEASTNLGAGTLRTFTGIVLPLIRPAFFAGLIWSFAKSMTTLSAIVFLVSARYNVLTAAVMNQVELGRFGPASALCTILIGIVLAFMAAAQVILRRLGVKTEISGA